MYRSIGKIETIVTLTDVRLLAPESQVKTSCLS